MILPPIGLYIHIPWCIKKCPYCDLNAYKANKNQSWNINYIHHLIQDLKQDIQLINNRTISTIFIGGGTPNLLNYKLIRFLINQIKKIVYLKKDIEITIEIHPEYITIQEILQYIQIGINRISIGIQSFNKKILKNIHRKYTTKKLMYLIHQIKNYQINFNIDLIYGLPNQTLKNCLLDLKKTILINPNHISWYQLNIEKNTIFHYQKPILPNENVINKMHHLGNKLLEEAQYQRYEISSYAIKNSFCYHNLNYWSFGDYIGIGCGAHGKITQNNGDIIRIIKKKRIYDYCSVINQYIENKQNISNQDKPFEYFMNQFRLFKPIKKQDFLLYTNLSQFTIHKAIQKAINKKYIYETKNYWHVLPYGHQFLNDLIELFLNI